MAATIFESPFPGVPVYVSEDVDPRERQKKKAIVQAVVQWAEDSGEMSEVEEPKSPRSVSLPFPGVVVFEDDDADPGIRKKKRDIVTAVNTWANVSYFGECSEEEEDPDQVDGPFPGVVIFDDDDCDPVIRKRKHEISEAVKAWSSTSSLPEVLETDAELPSEPFPGVVVFDDNDVDILVRKKKRDINAAVLSWSGSLSDEDLQEDSEELPCPFPGVTVFSDSDADPVVRKKKREISAAVQAWANTSPPPERHLVSEPEVEEIFPGVPLFSGDDVDPHKRQKKREICSAVQAWAGHPIVLNPDASSSSSPTRSRSPSISPPSLSPRSPPPTRTRSMSSHDKGGIVEGASQRKKEKRRAESGKSPEKRKGRHREKSKKSSRRNSSDAGQSSSTVRRSLSE